MKEFFHVDVSIDMDHEFNEYVLNNLGKFQV